MKRGKRILSFILIIALMVSLVPVGKDNVKEAEASDYQTIPDVILSDANENYPDEDGMKLFFPDITNVPASVYAEDSNASTEAKQNGKLLAVYYKNTVHARGFSAYSCTCAEGTPCSSDPYGEIHLVESTDHGETWSTPRKIVDSEILQTAGVGSEEVPLEGRDPNIAYLSDGTVILTFFTNHTAYDKTYNHTYILESHDGGTTWSDTPVQIDYLGQLCNGSKRGDIADFGDGYVLFPLQGRKTDDSKGYASAVYGKHTQNEETGKWEWTFERCTDVANSADEGCAINECSFVATGGLNGDEVYGLVRENGGVYHSADRGKTWTKVDTEEFQITDKDGNPAILNQPGLKLYDVEGEKYISVTYAVPSTVYGRPVYAKSVKLSDLEPLATNNTGWNNTKAELIYRCPNNTTEAGDPSSVITNDGRILVIYYDGLMEYIGGTYIEEPGSKSYTELTLGDFGIATSKTFGAFDNNNRTPLTTSNSSAPLDDVSISGIYNFTSTTSMLVGNVWSGISVGYYQDGNGEQIYFTIGGEAIRIYSKDIGGRALLGRDISMRMTFDYLRQDSGTVDFIMGVTFDGYTTHMKFENVAEGNLKQVMLVGNATVTNPSYVELLNNYEELTLEDFGVPTTVQFENADHKVIQTVTPDASLDGKMITGTYNFSTTSGSNQLVFGSSWFGVWIYAYEAYLNVYFYGYDNSATEYTNIAGTQITPDEVDGKPLLGRDLNIKMFFNFENSTSEGDVDVQCGIIVNDTCSKSMKFKSVAASNFKQAIGVTAPAGNPMTLKGEAEELTLEDFGIPMDMTFEGVDHKVIQTATPNESLDGKLISGTYCFAQPAGTSSVVFGSSWFGVNVMSQADNLYVYYYDGISNDGDLQYGQFSITPSEVDGTALTGRDIKLQLYFKYGNEDTENNKADVQVVFMIEGILVKNVIFKQVSIAGIGQKLGVTGNAGYPLKVKASAEELTLEDFGVLSVKTFENESHKQLQTMTPNESLDGKMISGIYNFYNASGTNILGIGSDWYGIWLMPSGDNLYGYYYDESGTSYSAFTITPSEVDGKTLPGRDLKLQVYFNYGNVENNRANVLATFIVEDIFVKSVLFENVSIAYIGEKLGITTNAGYPLRLITQYLIGDFDIDGLISDKDLKTLREAILSGLTDEAYNITSSDSVDVRDLVRLKKTFSNWFPQSAMTYAGIVNAQNAGTASEDYRTSDYISVSEGDTVYFGAADTTQAYHLVLLNSAKAGIGSVTAEDLTVTYDLGNNHAIYAYQVKEGTAYVRVVVSRGNYSDGAILVTVNRPFTLAQYEEICNVTTDGSALNDSSPLNGLKALYMGDSHMAGSYDKVSYKRSTRSYAGRIEANTGLVATNAAIGGAQITYDSSCELEDETHGKGYRWIWNQYLNNMENDYDVIVIGGGGNDARYGCTIGAMADIDNMAETEAEAALEANYNTFAGGLQRLFYHARKTWPDATLFYVTNYQMYDDTDWVVYKDFNPYFDVAKEVCEKYGVTFIDIYNIDDVNAEFEANVGAYYPDLMHLNPEGYDIITPYLQAAMEAKMSEQ